MAETYAVNLSQVESVTRQITPDIVEAPATFNADIFAQLHFKVLTGVEYQNSLFVYEGKSGVTRKYKQGGMAKKESGSMVERKLIVSPACGIYVENIQNFREKEPFHVDAEGNPVAPATELIVRNIGNQHASDVITNLFHGDDSKADSALGLYKGVYTLVEIEKTAGNITAAKMNLFTTGPIVADSEATAGDAFDTIRAAYNALHPALRLAPKVVCLLSPEAYTMVLDSYLKSYTGLQTDAANNKRFVGMDNVEFVSNSLMGKGSQIIFTVPDNIEFGCDTLNQQNGVQVAKNPEDQNELFFQVQSANGMRIRSVNAKFFAVNEQKNVMIEGLIDDEPSA